MGIHTALRSMKRKRGINFTLLGDSLIAAMKEREKMVPLLNSL
jgi:hypothetical protein